MNGHILALLPQTQTIELHSIKESIFNSVKIGIPI